MTGPTTQSFWRSKAVHVSLLTALVLSPVLVPECAYRGYLLASNRFESSDKFDIYVVGGSSSVGWPYSYDGRHHAAKGGDDGISFARVIAEMFNWEIQGLRIEVTYLARLGESTYPQQYRLRQAMRYRNPDRPGVVLIYSGHNDAAFAGEDAVSHEQSLFPYLLGVTEILYRSRQTFERRPAQSLSAYKARLEAMIKEVLGAGLIPVMATVVSNLTEIDPSINLSAGFTENDLGPGVEHEANGNIDRAIKAYAKQRKATRQSRDGLWAALTYRLARMHHRRGRTDIARELYWRALDADPKTHFGRATRQQNQVIRELAKQYGVPLYDAVKHFESTVDKTLVGHNLFADGHHPNMQGYLLLAQGFADVIAQQLKTPISRTFSDEAEVLAKLPLSDIAAHHLRAAGWYLASASMHPWPRFRLAGARRAAQSAVDLQPERFFAWLQLGLASIAPDSGLLTDEAFVDRLAQWAVFPSEFEPAEITQDALKQLVSRLRGAQCPERILKRLQETWPKRSQWNDPPPVR